MTPEELDAEFERALARVLSTRDGRLVIHGLAHRPELGGFARKLRVPGDEEATAHNYGRRELAIDILATAERVAPDLHDLMMAEAHDASRRPTRSLVPSDGDSSPQ